METFRARSKHQRLPIPDFEALKLDTNLSSCTSTYNAFIFSLYYLGTSVLATGGYQGLDTEVHDYQHRLCDFQVSLSSEQLL